MYTCPFSTVGVGFSFLVQDDTPVITVADKRAILINDFIFLLLINVK
jgi:hypothetical protein